MEEDVVPPPFFFISFMYDKEQYLDKGKLYENKTMEILERFVGGKCKPSTEKENKRDHIDVHWNYEGNDVTIDVKGPKKFNRWDNDNPSSDVVWIEVQGITGKPGWIYGKSTFIAFWLRNGITFVYTQKFRKLYEMVMINKHVYVGAKPSNPYELYQRNGRQDILFTMPVADLEKIQEYTISFDELRKLNYTI